MAIKRRAKAWTRKEFLDQVEPENLPLHKQLLAAMDGADGVEARFDGHGWTWASYNVYVPHLKEELLRVRAKGKRHHFGACIGHLRNEGQPERANHFKKLLATWIPEDAGGYPWLSKTIDEIDLRALVAVVEEVARHPAE